MEWYDEVQNLILMLGLDINLSVEPNPEYRFKVGNNEIEIIEVIGSKGESDDNKLFEEECFEEQDHKDDDDDDSIEKIEQDLIEYPLYNAPCC